MANIASAKKAARQAVKRRARNVSQRSALRSAIKDVRKPSPPGTRQRPRLLSSAR